MSALLCIAASAVLIGCGNKGSLFLTSEQSLIDQITTVEDALDELEAMEALEENIL